MHGQKTSKCTIRRDWKKRCAIQVKFKNENYALFGTTICLDYTKLRENIYVYIQQSKLNTLTYFAKGNCEAEGGGGTRLHRRDDSKLSDRAINKKTEYIA